MKECPFNTSAVRKSPNIISFETNLTSPKIIRILLTTVTLIFQKVFCLPNIFLAVGDMSTQGVISIRIVKRICIFLALWYENIKKFLSQAWAMLLPFKMRNGRRCNDDVGKALRLRLHYTYVLNIHCRLHCELARSLINSSCIILPNVGGFYFIQCFYIILQVM